MYTPAIIVRLRPVTPWRIGPDSGSHEQAASLLHSDAVFGAICEAMGQLGMLEEWLAAAAPAYGAPACRITSAFPFQRTALYVPPPAGIWPPPSASGRQRWKGATLIPAGAVRDLLKGTQLKEDDWFVDAHSGCLVPVGTRATTGPFRILHRSFAAVDRLNPAAVLPRTVACLQFAPGSGLWFAVAFDNPTAYAIWAPKIEQALRVLADTGIGGLRSAGFGRSRPPLIQPGVLEEMLLPGIAVSKPGSRGAWWTLSLFNPAASDQVDWSAGHYQLIERSGRSDGALKKSTRLVREGSVLVAPSAPLGRCLDVTPAAASHPVLRPGFAVSLSIPWQVAQ
jgi:CRISPR type III-A-associated RAMP protein Csm4